MALIPVNSLEKLKAPAMFGRCLYKVGIRGRVTNPAIRMISQNTKRGDYSPLLVEMEFLAPDVWRHQWIAHEVYLRC